MIEAHNNIAIILLAAGLGKRMKSEKAKVLHKICGKEMILYAMETAEKVAGNNIVVVVGHQAEEVKKVVSSKFDVSFAWQKDQLGTGHAVSTALPEISDSIRDVMVLCGDVPLVREKSLSKLVRDHRKEDRDISLVAVKVDSPKGYGRILFDENRNVVRIVEEADADEVQKKIDIINAGIYCVKRDFLTSGLKKIKADNAQNEYYFTDIIEIGRREKKKIGAIVEDRPEEFIGINSQEELQKVEDAVRRNIH